MASTEFPDGSQSRQNDQAMIPHPLGMLLTPQDFDFFDKVLPFLDEPMTPAQNEAYQGNLELLRQFIRTRDQDRISSLLAQVGKAGLDIKKAKEENLFVLSSGEVSIAVDQLERQTNTFFVQNPEVDFSLRNIYDLFLINIPFSIQGGRDGSASPREVKSSTEASITFQGAPRKGFRLRNPSEAEEFESTIQNRQDQISWVTMATDIVGMGYSITFRNVGRTSEKYFQFRFPSKDPFYPETMLTLLDLHVEVGKMGNRDERLVLAANFAKGITQIKNVLRVR